MNHNPLIPEFKAVHLEDEEMDNEELEKELQLLEKELQNELDETKQLKAQIEKKIEV